MSYWDAFDSDLETAAVKLAGNWRKFDSFGWDRWRDEDAGDWAIINTKHCDSGLMAESNHDAIVKSLELVDADGTDWRLEEHCHWAVGHCTAIVVRPLRNGVVTPAFQALHECAMGLAEYPLLDEMDHGTRLCDAQWESVMCVVWRKSSARIVGDEAHRALGERVMTYLQEHNDRALEDCDDSGYVDEDAVEDALREFGSHIDQDEDDAPVSAANGRL